MKLLTSSLIAALLALTSHALWAQGQSPAAVGDLSEDQLRGVVLEVNPETNTVTVQPKEVGESLNISTEDPVTFTVDEDTYIQDSLRSTILDMLRDVQVGDQVRMEFDPEDAERIQNIQREEEMQTDPS